MKLKNNKGFTLVELMVVVVIIGILATMAFQVYQSYINKSYDATRQSDLTGLVTSINSYKGNHLAPPLNLYALVGAGFTASLPVDPSNGKLYQYNVDLRGWNSSYMSQGSAGSNYLIATNQPLYDKNNTSVYDGEEYKAGKARPKIKNLKYYGGYLVMGNGDANLLTDNGKVDKTNDNKSSNSTSGGPTTPPSNCGSKDAGGNGQLDPYEGELETFIAKTTKNLGITVSEIYGPNISGSACKIIIKSDGNGTSVANSAVNLETTTGDPNYKDYYR